MSSQRWPSRRLRGHLTALLAGATLIVAACGGSSSPAPTTPTLGPSSTPTPPTAAAPSPTPSAAASSPPAGLDPARLTIRLEPVVRGLADPVAVVNAGDGSGRLFVVEQGGRIRIVTDGVLAPAPLLDISKRIVSGGEQGLLGLAFAPGFPADPRFFVDYTDLQGNTVVSSFTIPAATPDRADPGSERILLQIDQPFPNHNGGVLAFGPDGDLYVGMGDGGSGGDPFGNGQSLMTLLGKILRIRPTDAATTTGPPYAIPPGNPYANDSSARPEIFAAGMRNPWRLSFDRLTGDLWIGDVGQDAWEEVDHWPAGPSYASGPNFGWNVMEGNHCYNATVCDRTGLVLPVAEYSHAFGCAIVGGVVGRDQAEPALYGGYVFGDNCSGNIWVLDAADPTGSPPRLVLDSSRQISSFGEDEAGRLYLVDLASGELVRIVPGS